MQFQNILLIDDDEDDQEIFLSAVKKLSGSVVCNLLDDATAALKKLAVKELEPDVIFLDLNMPVMSGQHFLVEIKKHDELSRIPVIIFSTASNQTTIQLMKELGAHDFITKPDNFDELVNILKPIIA